MQFSSISPAPSSSTAFASSLVPINLTINISNEIRKQILQEVRSQMTNYLHSFTSKEIPRDP